MRGNCVQRAADAKQSLRFFQCRHCGLLQYGDHWAGQYSQVNVVWGESKMWDYGRESLIGGGRWFLVITFGMDPQPSETELMLDFWSEIIVIKLVCGSVRKMTKAFSHLITAVQDDHCGVLNII